MGVSAKPLAHQHLLLQKEKRLARDSVNMITQTRLRLSTYTALTPAPSPPTDTHAIQSGITASNNRTKICRASPSCPSCPLALLLQGLLPSSCPHPLSLTSVFPLLCSSEVSSCAAHVCSGTILPLLSPPLPGLHSAINTSPYLQLGRVASLCLRSGRKQPLH